MSDKLYKTLVIFIGICLVILLFGIYLNLENDRYKVSASVNGAVVIDGRTGDFHTPKEDK